MANGGNTNIRTKVIEALAKPETIEASAKFMEASAKVIDALTHAHKQFYDEHRMQRLERIPQTPIGILDDRDRQPPRLITCSERPTTYRRPSHSSPLSPSPIRTCTRTSTTRIHSVRPRRRSRSGSVVFVNLGADRYISSSISDHSSKVTCDCGWQKTFRTRYSSGRSQREKMRNYIQDAIQNHVDLHHPRRERGFNFLRD